MSSQRQKGMEWTIAEDQNQQGVLVSEEAGEGKEEEPKFFD
jgi:hypothetical protein